MLTHNVFTNKNKIALKASEISRRLKNKNAEPKLLEEIANAFAKSAKDSGIIPVNMSIEEVGDRVICAEVKNIGLTDDESYRSWITKITGTDWDYVPSTASIEEQLIKGIEAGVGIFIEKHSEMILERLCSKISNNPDTSIINKLAEAIKVIFTSRKEFDKRVELIVNMIMEKKDDYSLENLEKVLSQTKTQDKIIDKIFLFDEPKQKEK